MHFYTLLYTYIPYFWCQSCSVKAWVGLLPCCPIICGPIDIEWHRLTWHSLWKAKLGYEFGCNEYHTVFLSLFWHSCISSWHLYATASLTYITVCSNITSHMLKCTYKYIALCNFPVNITTHVLHIHIKHTFQVFITLSLFFTPNLHAAHTH